MQYNSSYCILSTSGSFLHFTLPQLSHLLCAMLSLSVMHLLLIVSALPDHHGNSSASLAVFTLASIITGCYIEIPQLLWQLRLFIFSVIDELILWKKPSFVSSSYIVKCNSSPPILFKFICTVELTSLNLAFILPFCTSAFQDPRGEYFVTLHVPIPETLKWILSTLSPSSIFHRCDQWL
jgi:hypothetical protein